MPTVTTPSNFPGTHYASLLGKRKNVTKRSEPLKGVKRALKLLLLCFILPLLLLIYPLYLRNRVYTPQEYPMSISDMLVIDRKISTTWCQNQLISANTTYNAYVIASEPQISKRSERIDMTRTMNLTDGAKEYWGFYLLKGSTFTVSTCVRSPGASLIVIEGHQNLKGCAYVGDNSSEEKDDDQSSDEKRDVDVLKKMTKIVPGIVIHQTLSPENFTSWNAAGGLRNESGTELPKTNRKLKNVHLRYAEGLYNKERDKNTNKSSPLRDGMADHARLMEPDDSLMLEELVKKLIESGPEGRQILNEQLNKLANAATNRDKWFRDRFEKILKSYPERRSSLKKNNGTNKDIEKEDRKKWSEKLMQLRFGASLVDEEQNNGQEVIDEADKADIHVSVNSTKPGDRSRSEYWSSVSSSEERLLECKGLLLSLPLIDHEQCDAMHGIQVLETAAIANSVSYQIQQNGHYFFIFNNENEIVAQNFLYSHFNIIKTVYDTSEAIAVCGNETRECSLPLSFWSRERTILEKQKPSTMNDDSWNEEFIVITRCEPRATMYVFCSMSVFVSILLFAFT